MNIAVGREADPQRCEGRLAETRSEKFKRGPLSAALFANRGSNRVYGTISTIRLVDGSTSTGSLSTTAYS